MSSGSWSIIPIVMLTIFLLMLPFCPRAEGGLWKDMKDAYREGREEAQVERAKKTIEERTEELWRGAMRRKAEEAKFLDEMMKSFRKGNIKIYAFLGIGLLIYLCERGSAGCDRDWCEEHLKRKEKKEELESQKELLEKEEKEKEVSNDR